MLLQPLREEVWAIGIQQGNTDLKTKIDAFLARFRADGGFARLGDKHLAKEKKTMQDLGIPFVFDLTPADFGKN